MGGAGGFRDQEPQRWQQLHGLHERFHRNAAQILELATAGKAAEANGRMRGADFTDIERQLQNALRTAVSV